jgi:ABC-2 type transport system permease protein
MNFYGLYTLYLKEVKRFLVVYHQTIFTPVLSALILLAVFVMSINAPDHMINGIPFIDFIGYGLIIMSITQNAFANSSSSLIMSKVIGYITDLLLPPLSGSEIVIAYTLASVTRGIAVGFMVFLCLLPFVSFHIHSIALLIFFAIASSALLGLLGILTGIVADGFDQNSAITNYLINPLSFLSGTFYSVDKLPHFLKVINQFNPFFYMIDGFRYSIIGVADSNIALGMTIIAAINLGLFLLLRHLINIGWRIKT